MFSSLFHLIMLDHTYAPSLVSQTRTHAQKYFQKKRDKDKGGDSGSDSGASSLFSHSTDGEGVYESSTSIAASPTKKRKSTSSPRAKKVVSPTKRRIVSNISNIVFHKAQEDTHAQVPPNTEDEFCFYCDFMLTDIDICNDTPSADAFEQGPLFESFNRERAFSDMAPPLLPMMNPAPLIRTNGLRGPTVVETKKTMEIKEEGHKKRKLNVVYAASSSAFGKTAIVTPTDLGSDGVGFFKGRGEEKQATDENRSPSLDDQGPLTIQLSLSILPTVSPVPIIKKQRGRPRKYGLATVPVATATQVVYLNTSLSNGSLSTASLSSASPLSSASQSIDSSVPMEGVATKTSYAGTATGNQLSTVEQHSYEYELFPTDSLESFLE